VSPCLGHLGDREQLEGAVDDRAALKRVDAQLGGVLLSVAAQVEFESKT
jgi:hypothetical protein